jgi:hypothetical protein
MILGYPDLLTFRQTDGGTYIFRISRALITQATVGDYDLNETIVTVQQNNNTNNNYGVYRFYP